MVQLLAPQAPGGRSTVVTDKVPENAVRLGLVAAAFSKRAGDPRPPPSARHGRVQFLPALHRDGAGVLDPPRLDRHAHAADGGQPWRSGRRALDLPILDVSYERLVAEPEAQARRIAEFAGLAWTDALLAPDRSAIAPVLTASVWQVRQPIYTSAVDALETLRAVARPDDRGDGRHGLDRGARSRSIQGSVPSRSTSRS